MLKSFNFSQHFTINSGGLADPSDYLLHYLQLSALWGYYLAPFLYDLAFALLYLSIHVNSCICEGKELWPIFAVLGLNQSVLVISTWFSLFQETVVWCIDLFHQSRVSHWFLNYPYHCHFFLDLDLAFRGYARSASSLECRRRSQLIYLTLLSLLFFLFHLLSLLLLSKWWWFWNGLWNLWLVSLEDPGASHWIIVALFLTLCEYHFRGLLLLACKFAYKTEKSAFLRSILLFFLLFHCRRLWFALFLFYPFLLFLILPFVSASASDFLCDFPNKTSSYFIL